DHVFAQVQALEADVLGSRATITARSANARTFQLFTQMTTYEIPPQETLPPPHQDASPKRSKPWLLWAAVAVFAVLVAGATYVVSNSISPTYESSAQFRISVNESAGLSQDALLASNSLTAQLVQLLPTDAVLAAPAEQLGMSVS